MKVVIILQYENASEQYLIWSESERDINFRTDLAAARRCTAAFAAAELQRYLLRTINTLEITIDSVRPADGIFIELRISEVEDFSSEFSIKPVKEGIVVTGFSRAGLLYGVYELIRMQGWRWYAPGSNGEIVPGKIDKIRFPDNSIEEVPSMKYRGFDFEKISMESSDLLLWMARNRMNVFGWRFASGPLGRKLGMMASGGGHIFESILNPDRILSDGNTLWDARRDWYGIPKSGVREKRIALQTQFCVSAEGLIDYLGDLIIKKINMEWKDLDIVYLWGFDTWGGVCNCSACKALGNSTDILMHFLSGLRELLNTAVIEGRLDHNVQIAACAYEGTNSLIPPTKAIPGNLIEGGDIIIYYPINRCYRHDMFNESCKVNNYYSDTLSGWLKIEKRMELWVGEYYNVSKYEDLPLLFSGIMSNDIPEYRRRGIDGMTYMHLPLVNWAMRTQTQLLYAQMLWDSTLDVKIFLREYFLEWYGKYAEEMSHVYGIIEESWSQVSQWRNWHKSILAQLLIWDGNKPTIPLLTNYHFYSIEEFIQSERGSLASLHIAMETMDNLIISGKEGSSTVDNDELIDAVNPQEQMESLKVNEYNSRVAEDRRLLKYGIDTLSLMIDVAAYHNELYVGGDRVFFLRHKIKEASNIMDLYYIPISYEQPGAGLRSYDALTRTQLRMVLERCSLF